MDTGKYYPVRLDNGALSLAKVIVDDDNQRKVGFPIMQVRLEAPTFEDLLNRMKECRDTFGAIVYDLERNRSQELSHTEVTELF